jgi:hypothetical protein
MNVLDVYPTFSWWICGADADEIANIRALLEHDSSAAENSRKAYCLIGDAAAFDLIPETFDQILVRYSPTPLKRLVLERHTRAWLKPGATLAYNAEPDKEALAPHEPPRLSIRGFHLA